MMPRRLRDLGYTSEKIAELHRKKVVAATGLDRHHHHVEELLHKLATGGNGAASRKELSAGKPSMAKT